MQPPIQLIVGLGNPGTEYEQTRHNAGAWFIEKLCREYSASLKAEKKFHGLFSKIKIANHDCYLLLPTTYMNDSGLAVSAVAKFYKTEPESILVAHDDLDLPEGDIRLKQGGGHGGHNGLRSIIAHLGTNHFTRMRIGINHPGDKNKVVNYVLGKAKKDEQEKIMDSIDRGLKLIPEIISGDLQKAMQTLHTGDK